MKITYVREYRTHCQIKGTGKLLARQPAPDHMPANMDKVVVMHFDSIEEHNNILSAFCIMFKGSTIKQLEPEVKKCREYEMCDICHG